MKNALIDLFTSKKFLTALTAIAVYIAGRFGFNLDTSVLDRIYAALLVYVGAQGIADVGKSAAQVTAAANSAGSATPATQVGAAMRGVTSGATAAALIVLALGGAAMTSACGLT